jgi:SPFH domain / Band 7 family
MVDQLDSDAVRVARLRQVQKLAREFDEKPNSCSVLHDRAREFWEAQNGFDDAVRCCQESYRLGLELGDSYIRAASRFYHGLTLFMLKDARHWDQAAAYCEESATLLHGLGERAARGVAWLAVGTIADAQTEAGYDRLNRALHAYLQVSNPLAENPDDLAKAAEEAYAQAVAQLGQKKVTASGALPQTPAEAERDAPGTSPSPVRADGHASSPGVPPLSAEEKLPTPTPPVPGAEPEVEVASHADEFPKPRAAPIFDEEQNVAPRGAEPVVAESLASTELPTLRMMVPSTPLSESAARAQPLPAQPFIHRKDDYRTIRDLRARQSALVLLTIGLMAALGTLALALAAIGAWDFWSAQPEAGPLLAVLLLTALLITTSDLLLLQQTGQLFFVNQRDCAAIIDAHGHLGSVEKQGFHFIVLFVEKLEAFIRLVPAEWETVLVNIPIEDQSFFSAHLKMRYRVVDARRVWNAIRPEVPRTQRLGEDCPALTERTSKYLKAHLEQEMGSVVRRALTHLASDPNQRHVLRSRRELGEYVTQALAGAEETIGIHFYRIAVEAYSPFR